MYNSDELNLLISAEGGKAPLVSSGSVASTNVKVTKPAKPSSQKNDVAAVAAGPSEKKGGQAEKDRKKDAPHPRMQYDDESRVVKAKRRAVVKQTEAKNRVELFRHLPQYEHGTQLPDLETKFFQLDPMHPAVYKVQMFTLHMVVSLLLLNEYLLLWLSSGWSSISLRGYIWWQRQMHCDAPSIPRGRQRLFDTL